MFVSLAEICPFNKEIDCRQVATPTPMLPPTGSALKTICPPPPTPMVGGHNKYSFHWKKCFIWSYECFRHFCYCCFSPLLKKGLLYKERFCFQRKNFYCLQGDKFSVLYLLFYISSSFWKGIKRGYSQRKEFTPCGRVNPFLKGCKNNLTKLPPLKEYPFPLRGLHTLHIFCNYVQGGQLLWLPVCFLVQKKKKTFWKGGSTLNRKNLLPKGAISFL